MKEKQPKICDSKWCGRKADFDVHITFSMGGVEKEKYHRTLCRWHAAKYESNVGFEGTRHECRMDVTKTPIEEDA